MVTRLVLQTSRSETGRPILVKGHLSSPGEGEELHTPWSAFIPVCCCYVTECFVHPVS